MTITTFCTLTLLHDGERDDEGLLDGLLDESEEGDNDGLLDDLEEGDNDGCVEIDGT